MQSQADCSAKVVLGYHLAVILVRCNQQIILIKEKCITYTGNKRPQSIAVEPVVEALNSDRSSIELHIVEDMKKIFILNQMCSD